MFGRHSATAVADRDTAADDRTEVVETPRVVDQTMTDSDVTQRRAPVVDDERVVEPTPSEDERVVEKREPVAVVPEAEPQRWAHVSFMAALSLVIGVLAVAATLTGLLAPVGFAAGVLAVLVGALATYSVSRPNVTGHGLVVFGVLFGAIAIILSLLAINGQLSWLSSDTNEITTVHNWLNDNLHWMRRW
jgi:hypothetical protein